jgi:hypothetical protein
MAHMQLEVEKQIKKKSPISNVVSLFYCSTGKLHLFTSYMAERLMCFKPHLRLWFLTLGGILWYYICTNMLMNDSINLLQVKMPFLENLQHKVGNEDLYLLNLGQLQVLVNGLHTQIESKWMASTYKLKVSEWPPHTNRK